MEIPDSWKKAGKLAAQALTYGASLVKEKALYLDVANKVDDFILKRGGHLGFPVQLSTNSLAAHYTPSPDDTLEFNYGDLVKLDLGVQIEGYIGDNAVTIEVGSKDKAELMKASQEALKAAIALAKPGVKVWEIGAAVSSTIKGFGFEPIRNLSGHGIAKWNLHAPPSIPNYDNKDPYTLTAGQALAIEPFATEGVGLVKEGKESGNYRLSNANKQVRDMNARKVLKHIKEEYQSLPFSKRALVKEFREAKAKFALATLERNHIIYGYAQLPEKADGMTSQHEHTVMVAEKPIILTKD